MKKFLSMALALVMSLSLCAVFTATKASAGFADEDQLSSRYAVQAADVIRTIEVMDGYSDDTFRPTAGLTRQAAAKIICNMILGPTTAKALPTNARPFPDVLPSADGRDNQFAGYISYCAQQGIISGYSDGTFKPSDPLSGYAYLKMLLGALGYDAQHEGFVGENWKVNVAKIALGIGLNKGIEEDLDGTTQVTREAAAIYAFNTIQGDMVEYDAKNTIEVNGVSISMGGGNAIPQTWNTSSTSADNINARTSDGNNQRPIVQFAERYFDKLVREPNEWDIYTQDDFGRPSIKWFWKGIEIGTYSRDPDAVFVGNVKVNAIYEALGMTSGDDHACLYINSADANNEDLEVKRANDKDLDHETNLLMFRGDNVKHGDTVNEVRADYGFGNVAGGNRAVTDDDVGNSINAYGDGNHRVDRIGDGTLIECFRNEANNHVDVCVISVYGGKVDAVKAATAKKDRYVTIVYAPDDQAAHRPDSIEGTGNNEFETEDFEEEDYIAYTYSDSAADIKSMYLMTAESGSLTSRVSEKNVRLDDTVYPFGKEYAFYEMTENDLSSKSSYVVYSFRWGDIAKYADWADDDDLVLWVEEDEFAVDQYVLIERITIENRRGQNASSTLGASAPADVQAVVRNSAGNRRTYNLDDSKNYRNANAADDDRTANAIAPAFRAGRIVRLSNNSNGYRLHALDDKYMFSVNNFTIEGKDIWANGVIRTPVIRDDNGNRIAGGETLIVDSETHFTVEDTESDTYKAYLGTKNVPDVKGNGGTAYIYHRGALAKQIFITQAADVSSSSKDVIFLVAPSTSNLVESDDGNYYDVTAVDKDQVVTLRIKQGTAFDETGSYFMPGSDIDNTKNEGNCVLLNKITYDSNDLVIDGDFDFTKVSSNRATGIRRVNAEEVRFDTGTNGSYLRDVAENVRVFFCDGSDVEQIGYDEIVNDTKDAIYYVEDDSVVTYIFIVNFEDEGWPTAAVPPVEVPEYDIDSQNSIAEGYAVEIAQRTVEAGGRFGFRVLNNAQPPAIMTPADVTVAITCATEDNADYVQYLTEDNFNAETGYWDVTVPETVIDTVILVVEPVVAE